LPSVLSSPTDLSPAKAKSLFARATEIAQGAVPNLNQARVALALSNSYFPLPLHTEDVLREAGATIIPITAGSELGQIAREVRASGATLVLFSHGQAGAAYELAGKLNQPLINAGAGTNENPARGLMDAFAIFTLKGNLELCRVAILGNLKFSAEAHSLARVLGIFGSRLSFVSPAALSMPYDLTDEVRLAAYEVEETNDLPTTLLKTDALYLANIDPLRVEKKIYDKLKNFYVLTPETFVGSKEGIVVLGEWDGAQNLLAATRPHVERASRAMLLAIVEEVLV
jgi:hypothetical protein